MFFFIMKSVTLLNDIRSDVMTLNEMKFIPEKWCKSKILWVGVALKVFKKIHLLIFIFAIFLIKDKKMG